MQYHRAEFSKNPLNIGADWLDFRLRLCFQRVGCCLTATPEGRRRTCPNRDSDERKRKFVRARKQKPTALIYLFLYTAEGYSDNSSLLDFVEGRFS